MIKENILKKITVNDLPGRDLKLIADACGLEVAISLMCNACGVRFYVPHNGLTRFMEKYILENPDLCAREFALMLGVSETKIYTLMHDVKTKSKHINLKAIR